MHPNPIAKYAAECADLKKRADDARRKGTAHTYLEWRHIQATRKLIEAELKAERKQRRTA